MIAHIVENGLVVNTIVVDSLNDLPNLVDGSVGGIGWSYVDGQFLPPTPEPEVVKVPSSITPRQIRLQLTAMGLRQQVEDWVATQSLDIKDWWEFSTVFERNNQMLVDAAAIFGLTSESLDAFFIEANKL